jgi:hypothetical protein
MAFAGSVTVGVGIRSTDEDAELCAEAIESIAAAATADTNVVEIMMKRS